ncbi:MAG: L-threonylcarbamoyladenylate synthase [Bacteroidota bacterium]
MNKFSTQIGSDLQQAALWLQQGEPVAVPTETVYGLAANALDPAAVVKIFEVKKRPAFDPLIVHLSDAAFVTSYVQDFPPMAKRLSEAFWPGPLTLLLPKNERIPDLVTSGLSRVALRVPAHPLMRALLNALPFPLAAPSANPFGYISPTTAQHVWDQLQGEIPYILDGGPCKIGMESTIVGFEAEQMIVYRLGGLSLEALESVAGPVSVQLNQSSNPAAPGMLKTHYAPRKPMFLGELSQLLKTHKGKKTGILSLKPLKLALENGTQLALSEQGDLAEAAQRLFAALRLLDSSDVDLILAEPMPEIGLGRAINDRLRRAAAPPDHL